MTYTFKLARRLAVSRCFGMLPAIILFAACSGADAIAPNGSPADVPASGIYDWRPRESTPVVVHINPSSVTLETNQLIRFRANGRNRAGDTVAAPVVWTTTGGSILPDGRFSAAVVGTYQVIGRTPTHDNGPVVDTSIVTVVRRQIRLVSLEITPGNATMTPGVSQSFTALGRLKNGSPVPIGALWSATGGTIDAGGTYVAGDTAGTYRVMATNTTGSVADTATITISAPPSPPPPDSLPTPTPPIIPVQPPTSPVPPPPAPEPPPPPPPAPTLQQVTLMPATVTLAPATKKQFVAFGRNTAGDSVTVNVTFSATGGTVTTGGLYTAGSTGGTFRIIATSGTLADTSVITVTSPLNSGSLPGIPIGTFHLPIDRLGDPSLSYNGATMNANPPTLLSDLATIKAKGARVILAMRRGSLKDASGLSVAAGTTEINSWPDISSFIADGTVIAIYIADDIGATEWGSYSMTERLSRWDAIGGVVRARWPDVAVAMRAKPSELAARSQWINVTTAWAQYKGPYRDGSPESYRDAQVAAAKALRMGLVLWLNVLDGGCGPTSACMPGVPGTGILGTYVDAASVRRFQMSAAEVLHYGTVFLNEPYNCAAIQWRWSPTFAASLPADQLAGIRAFDTRSDVRSSMASLAALASQRPKASCRQGR